jgi:hypothetical protein
MLRIAPKQLLQIRNKSQSLFVSVAPLADTPRISLVGWKVAEPEWPPSAGRDFIPERQEMPGPVPYSSPFSDFSSLSFPAKLYIPFFSFFHPQEPGASFSKFKGCRSHSNHLHFNPSSGAHIKNVLCCAAYFVLTCCGIN